MLINANWLKKNIKKKTIKVLDASWHLPNSNKNSLKEYYYSHIPNASFLILIKFAKRIQDYLICYQIKIILKPLFQN